MVSLVYDDPREVDRVLRQRFWSDRSHWIDIVKSAVAARGGCTDDFPKSAAGYHAWSNGIARLRQIFRREGWEKDEDEGIETVTHADLKVKVTVMNADRGTCDPTRSPQNRTVKGPAAQKVTDLNNQFELFAEHEVSKKPEGFPIWYLCIYDNGRTVRAELSRPVAFRSGFFEKFAERIFIVRGDDWSKIAVESPAEPHVPEYDIPVRRR